MSMVSAQMEDMGTQRSDGPTRSAASTPVAAASLAQSPGGTLAPTANRSRMDNRPIANVAVLRHIPVRLAAILLQILLLGLTVLVGVKLFWTLFAPLPYPQTTPTIVPAAQGQPDIADRISARNPFAMTGAPVNDVVVVETATLQETSLDLVLHGVIVNGDNSSAIIDVRNGDGQNSFGLGTEIVDGVSLAEVRFTEVVIEREGVREVLRMRDADGAPSGRTPRNRQSSGLVRNGSIRNRAVQNSVPAGVPQITQPQGNAAAPTTGNDSGEDNLFQLRDLVSFRIRQGDDGNPQLYLYPGRNRSAFAQAGLVPQDLLVSINGAPPPTDLRRAYQSAERALETGRINLVVERDGVPKNVTIDIEQVITIQSDQALTLPSGDEVEL
ncbi:MAG: type II secretion system protein N [Pseudomonadota bacterium]